MNISSATKEEIRATCIPWVTTLKTRGMDSLDFTEVSAATLTGLIEEAYKRGYQDGRADHIIESG